MGNPVVLCETDRRGVATVTLNRPEVNNAYNAEVVQALLDIFTGLAAERAVRVVVIRGNGRHFQAGADLKWLQEIGRMDAETNRATAVKTAARREPLSPSPGSTAARAGACRWRARSRSRSPRPRDPARPRRRRARARWAG